MNHALKHMGFVQEEMHLSLEACKLFVVGSTADVVSHGRLYFCPASSDDSMSQILSAYVHTAEGFVDRGGRLLEFKSDWLSDHLLTHEFSRRPGEWLIPNAIQSDNEENFKQDMRAVYLTSSLVALSRLPRRGLIQVAKT
jgi:hypothetical protein